ncbi:putative immunity repressor protein [[Clostridium] sordellii ATCC 9714]|nr:putative immunity repressor protein [[Clostridium] sordellii ATCC 9714] [Paeniclostridium sordellii ATCC 9714]
MKKAIEEIKDELENSNSLMFDGECLSEDAISSLLSAMEVGLSIAKKNKKK